MQISFNCFQKTHKIKKLMSLLWFFYYLIFFISKPFVSTQNNNFNYSSIPSIQSTYFSHKVLKHYWCSNPDHLDDNLHENPKILIGLFENGITFRSEDHGLSFIELSLNSSIADLHQHPNFPNLLYFISDKMMLIYYSQNCGFQIKPVQKAEFVFKNFKFNYGNSIFIIVQSLDDKYFLSENYGEIWYELDRINTTTTKHIEWAFNNKNMLKLVNFQRIIAQVHNEVVYTDDFFINTHIISKNITHFTLLSQYLFLIDNGNNEFKLYINDIYQLHEPSINVYRTYFSHFYENPINLSPLDIDGAIYILLSSKETNFTLFSSEIRPDYYFVQGIQKILSPKQCSIVKTLTGIILINQMVDSLVIRTLISFNKGTTWQYLKLENSNYTLNLNLETLNSSYFTIGLLLANGYIEDKLIPNESNTYLSRNAGFTWFEIKKGKNLFAITNLGSLLILVDQDIPTNHFFYSWNQGESIQTYNFTENNMIKVLNISSEPNRFSQKLVIFGVDPINQQGIIISIRFSQRICKGIWEPDLLSSDYETWIPEHEFSKCVLGKKMNVIRRKQHAECFNPELDRPTLDSYCECEITDYQCDYGFYYNESTKNCEKLYEISIDMKSECKNGYINILTGYRKIPGDDCIGGIEKGPFQIKCQESNINVTSTFTKKNDWKDLFTKNYFIVIIVIMILVLCYFHKVIEKFFSKRVENFQSVLDSKMKRSKEKAYKRFKGNIDKENFEKISEVNEDQESSSLLV